jgi:hypothetical protein
MPFRSVTARSVHSSCLWFAFVEPVQCVRKVHPFRSQFGEALPGYPFDEFDPARKQFHEDGSPVVTVLVSAHVPALLQPVDQFHCAVVPQHQPLRQGLDSGFRAFREAANCKQQEILLWFNAQAAGRGIGVAQKNAYPITQRGQRSVIGGRDLGCHKSIIS